MRHKLAIFGWVLVAAVWAGSLPLHAQSAQSTSKSSKQQTSRKASKTGTSEKEFQKAVEAVQAKDFQTAEPILRQLAEENPKNYQVWFYLGYVYNETNRQDEAVAAYRKAQALQPEVLEINLNLGMLLAAKGESAAGAFLSKAGKLKPDAEQQKALANAWLLLASRISQTDFAGATDAYQRAADLRPADPSPLIELGQLYEKHKQDAGAEKAYKQALQRDPKSSSALATLSNLYMRSNRLADAEQTLAAYVQNFPQDPNGHLQLGRVYRAENQNEKAAAEFEKALEIHPGDRHALRELGAVQLAAKQYAAAEATVKTLLASEPQDVQLHFLMANTLLKQLKYGQAQAEYLTVVKMKPDWGEAYGELAVAASENKNYELAIRALDARAKLMGGDTPGTYFLRATCFDHLQAYQQASENYKQFLEVADGKYPDQEWQARHRLIAIDPNKGKKQKK